MLLFASERSENIQMFKNDQSACSLNARVKKKEKTFLNILRTFRKTISWECKQNVLGTFLLAWKVSLFSSIEFRSITVKFRSRNVKLVVLLKHLHELFRRTKEVVI